MDASTYLLDRLPPVPPAQGCQAERDHGPAAQVGGESPLTDELLRRLREAGL